MFRSALDTSIKPTLCPRKSGPTQVELLSRQLGVEIFRLEQWREKAIAGIDASLKERKGDPVKAELDIAMKRIGELIMQVELLEAKTETSGPLGRRRSRR